LENKSKDNKEKKYIFFLKSAIKVTEGGRSWAAVGGWQRQLVAGDG
jgi:hypothetical protein